MKQLINRLRSLIESENILYYDMPKTGEELQKMLSDIRNSTRYEDCEQAFKNELKKLIGARATKEARVSGAIITKDFYTRENFSEAHTIANIGGLFYIVTCMKDIDYFWNDSVSFMETGIFNKMPSKRFAYGYFATMKSQDIAATMNDMFRQNAEENK